MVVRTVVSEWKSVNLDVPQVSVLGPVLQFTCINDMP